MKKLTYIVLFTIILVSTISFIGKSIIDQIQKRYTEINQTIDLYQQKTNLDINVYKDINPDKYSYEGIKIYRLGIVNLERFYDGQNLRKAIVKFEGESEDLTSEYYYWSDSIFFVFKTYIIYDKPKWADDFNNENKVIKENRFYFDGDILIKWINSEHQEVKSSDNQFSENEKWIISDSNLYKEIK